MLGLLFGFRGRISRGTYWAIKLSVAFVVVVIVVGVMQIGHAQPGDRRGFDHALQRLPPALHVATIGALLVSVWVVAAAYVKRLHDLDLSGGQFFGAHWRVMFNDGTVGANRFGPDPLVRHPPSS